MARGLAPVPVAVRETACGAVLSNSRFDVAPGQPVFELRTALHGRDAVTVDMDDETALCVAVLLIRAVYRRRNETAVAPVAAGHADTSGKAKWQQERKARAAQ